MMQKHTVLTAICLAAFVVACSQVNAQTEVLISDFETDTCSTLGPCWTGGDDASIQVVNDLGFEPQGTGMLEIVHAEEWNNTSPYVSLGGTLVAQALSQSTALKFDFLAPQDFSWRQVFVIAQGSSMNWTQVGFGEINTGPEFPTEVEVDLTQSY